MLRDLVRGIRKSPGSTHDEVTRARNQRDDRHMEAALAAVLSTTSRCVDVGANVGSVAELFARFAPEGRHVLVEAIPQLADDLRTRFPTAEVHAVACSDETGTATFNVAVDQPTLSGLGQGKIRDDQRVERIEVPLRRLDDLVDFAPTVLKIDVEGAELQVLQGATRTLEACPVVFFEHSNRIAPQFGTRPEDVHRLLSEHGYRLYDMDGAGPLEESRFAASFHAHERFNWMARRR